MSGFFNGRFEKQRALVSRQFDKVVLARVLFVLIAVQFLLQWLLLQLFGASETGRVLGIVTDFSNTMNGAITVTVGFIGGIMTGKALEASRASDRAEAAPPAPTPAPTPGATPPEPPNGSNAP
jgi:hypothetical protein